MNNLKSYISQVFSIQLVLTIAISFVITTNSNAQRESVKDFSVQSSTGVFAGKTKAISEVAPMPNTSDVKRKIRKQNKKPVNFLGRGKTDPSKLSPTALPKNGDPVRQTSIQKKAGREATILVDMEGLTGGSPNDPCGDVGKDFYIQMINATSWQVFDKAGTAVTGEMTMNTIWSQVGFSSAGDPIILYDQEYDRWILTEFPPSNQLLVAVSETSDPLGSYYVYNFPTPSFPDYPKFALWDNTLYATTNEGGFGTSSAYFIDRLALINGLEDPAIQRLTFPGVSVVSWYTPTPVDWTGANKPEADSPPIILNLMDDAWGLTDQDQIDMYHFNIDFEDSSNTDVDVVEVPTAPFVATDTEFCGALGAFFACIPQPNGQGIDGLPQVIMHQSHYRNFGTYESIVLNFTVAPSDTELIAGIRWMELRKTPSQEWHVYQEGTFAPDDSENRFMGGIAMDGKGNIGLAYAVSSFNTYPSLRFTGRYASDPLGEMTLDEVEFGTGVSSSNGSRFGDYAQMTIDPQDDISFWFTAEYRGLQSSSSTRILSFQFERDTNDIGPSAILEPQDSGELTDSETVRVQVRNFGLDTQYMFSVGYSLDGIEMESDVVDYLLAPDSFYMHTFDAPVDLSVVGPYDFEVYTTMDSDQFIQNDTLRQVVQKLPRYDAAITDVDVKSPVCSSETTMFIELTNYGSIDLESVTIIYEINSVMFSIDWTGNLQRLHSEVIEINVADLENGTNIFRFRTDEPNGAVDEITDNDEMTGSFLALADAANVFLNIQLDEYPNEVTWVIQDMNSIEVATGGPYAEEFGFVVEELCIDPEACYTFTIFDSFGDGICCQFGEGFYSITDSEGRPLLIGNGEYGDFQTSDFCATFACNLSADVEVSPESAEGLSDGTILINSENAVSEVSYSIDGGMTFQGNPFFNNLPAGEYEIFLETEFGCTYSETVNLTACGLEVIITIVDESVINIGDGSIGISVNNATDPIQFSIDGGQSFQDIGDFQGLINGDYNIIVRDGAGCEYVETVTVDYVTATEDEKSSGYFVNVAPNPTDGVFKVHYYKPNASEIYSTVYIYNSEGKRIQTTKLGLWDGVYEGMFSLVAYPSGTYYLKFADRDMQKLVRVVKL